MAVEQVQLPEIGEGVNEGELVTWLVQPGDAIEVDQPIVELMTDKATVEVPSPMAGTVKELKFGEGDTVEVGATLITLDSSGASSSPSTENPSAPATSDASATGSTPSPAQPAVAASGSAMAVSSPSGPGAAASSAQGGGLQPPVAAIEVLATPSTRRLAREMNIDINQIKGTGLAGRVTRDDILKVSQNGAAPSSMQAGPATPVTAYSTPPLWNGGGEERIPLKGIRKKIAENMQMAKRVIPHFTLMDEANVSALVDLRKSLKPHAEKMGIKVTYLPFVFKALIATVKEFPKFNGMIDDEAQEIVYKKFFNVGFAADTPNGLLVPVIKNADQKTIYQLSQEIVDLATRAREGKLKLDEMKGATFTVTNIGSVGGTYATPIINHPEVAIFGMYKIQERPFIQDGELTSAQFMNFTVTCDHRLIDGAEAARFLSAFIQRIENPGRLMMDMV